MPSNLSPLSVLHVGVGPSSMEAGLSAALADSFEVCPCNDVYLAIVRLMRPAAETMPGRDIPAAVIVSLDTMEHAELEFFSIVARFLPSLPVLVYGRSEVSELLDEALDLGATGRATEESIRALASRLAPPAAAVHPEETPLEVEAEGIATALPSGGITTADEPPIQVIDEDADETEDENENEIQADADEPSGPVRVPWLRYANTPPRSAPTAPLQPHNLEPSIPSSMGDEPEPPARHTPLLTEEELQALMGPEDSNEAEADTHPHHDEDIEGGPQELER